MKRYPSMVSLFAAAGTAAMLTAAILTWAVPAVAAEDAVATDVSAKAASSMERRHVPARIALSRYVRHVSPAPRQADCSGSWCGRHFVLMVGIGY
jgi:hypothetical protein